MSSESRLALIQLLRAIDRHITSATGNKQWRQFVISVSRKHQTETDHKKLEALRQDAANYTYLIESIHRHKELLLCYNIGIDIEAREKDMNKRAANLVGLSMPDPVDHESH